MTLKKRATTSSPAVTVYVTPTCANCPKTLHILRERSIPHTVVDLSADTTAYTYVTQDLGYRAAPIVVASDGMEQVSWSGHNPELIAEHILVKHSPVVAEPSPFDSIGVDMDDGKGTPITTRITAADNTTAAIRNSGLGERKGTNIIGQATTPGNQPGVVSHTGETDITNYPPLHFETE